MLSLNLTEAVKHSQIRRENNDLQLRVHSRTCADVTAEGLMQDTEEDGNVMTVIMMTTIEDASLCASF